MHHPIGRFLRGAAPVVVMLGSTLLSACAGMDASTSAATPVAAASCASEDLSSSKVKIGAYLASGTFSARQEDANGHTLAVSVEIPAIHFTGPGQSSTLPVGPCQYIHRFVFPVVVAPTGAVVEPFAYAEIDWNTEGLPRGPNGSFSSPHFDFHFYLAPQKAVDAAMSCISSNGKTCDPLKTDYAQMERFLDLPDASSVPATYRPDVDSSISSMGLHLIDSTFDYTVKNVDHTPTLLYGTFAGKIVFAESSVTLQTLQYVVAAPGGSLRFPFAQPAAYASGSDWPTSFVIQYLPDTGGFKAGFSGFVHHD
ncbi:MAG: hypothetical protein ABIO74_12415 [Dokdonella sp.]